MKKQRALSIRQPYAEAIMMGVKKIEYRSIPTKILGEIYVYASLKPVPKEFYGETDFTPDDFPLGYVIGTIEIYGCRKNKDGQHEWLLKNPKRLKKIVKPDTDQKPQPVWFYPFGKE
jgi:hypothetical protein